MAGTSPQPGQQVEARGYLAKSGEMMLDEERAVIAERLGLDIVLNEFTKPLTAVGIGPGASCLRAAEESKSHSLLLVLFPPLARGEELVTAVAALPSRTAAAATAS